MNHPLPLTPEALARGIRGELDATGLSNREIERRTGISRHTLDRRIASGKLGADDLHAIARLLNVKLSTLIIRAERRAAQ